ncbi:MAG: SDR family oxidoreductase [Proteobacteria bacterium]|nr:SDR family oxidoreductase [Pseudomonadota bacterium]
MSEYRLKERYALVTGASSGIGRAMAERLAEAGAHCACLAGSPEKMETLREWASDLASRHRVAVHPLQADLSLEDGPETVFARVEAVFPRVDILVNSAGLMYYGDFADTALERHERLLQVNVRAYLALMRLVLPGMIERGQGRVLNVSSASAFQPTPHFAMYGASKAFVLSLSEAVNQELRGTGVMVCALCPSHVRTPMIVNPDFPGRLWWYSLSGLADPDEVARQGVRALKKGRPVSVPGLRHKFFHLLLPRLTPRRLSGYISYHALKARKP